MLTVSQKQPRERTSLTRGEAVKTVQDWECWRDLVRALFVEWHEEVLIRYVPQTCGQRFHLLFWQDQLVEKCMAFLDTLA